jgi:hypothetical protein
MKKTLFILLIILGTKPGYSQDIFKELQKLTLENDSLQKQVILPLNNIIINLKKTNDSLSISNQEQIKILANEQINLNEQIKRYESTIAELNKNKIKIERDNFKNNVDSLLIINGDLGKTISENKLQIKNNQQLCDDEKRKEYENGKLELINKLAQFYSKPFDDLITSSSLIIVERDMQIVGNKVDFIQKLLDLQKYFNAEQVLHEKFNKQNILFAINQIGNLEKTERVKNLNENLNNYELMKDEFNKVLGKIDGIDKKQIANDEYTQDVKMKSILLELSKYIKNYRINFSNFPYLYEIVFDIIKLKQKDANTDIKYLTDKL